MAVSDDRKYTKAFVYNLLEGVKGKTLGEVDSSHQFARTLKSDKITGIAGDVIEQSVSSTSRATTASGISNNPSFFQASTNKSPLLIEAFLVS